MSTIIGTTLNADTIRKTGGSLGTDIRIKNTSVYESDGGTSVTQNLVQGLCKCWISQDGTASNAAAHDSFNVSGTTDNGTGDYTIAISNDMSNANYCISSGGGQKTGSIANNDIAVFHKSLTTSQYGVQGTRFSSGNNTSLKENTLFCSMVTGDLA
tara:strand:+ start:204 stop:671 length:468 start_codon:yes stop_codon:yes gene_type:complete